MVGTVSIFRQVLNFQLSLHQQVKSQISRAFSEIQGDGSGVAQIQPVKTGSAPSRPSSSASGSQRSSGKNRQSSSSSSSSAPRRTSRSSNTEAAASQSRQRRSSRSRQKSSIGSQKRRRVSGGDRRNRKTIANTQADKRGRRESMEKD